MTVTNNDLVIGAFVFVLSVFIGVELITRVPSTLHTPLMSATNAIHGIVLVGAMVVAASSTGVLGGAIGVAAVTLGTLNVVGGYVVTDRMLQMFRRRRPAVPPSGDASE